MCVITMPKRLTCPFIHGDNDEGDIYSDDRSPVLPTNAVILLVAICIVLMHFFSCFAAGIFVQMCWHIFQ